MRHHCRRKHGGRNVGDHARTRERRQSRTDLTASTFATSYFGTASNSLRNHVSGLSSSSLNGTSVGSLALDTSPLPPLELPPPELTFDFLLFDGLLLPLPLTGDSMILLLELVRDGSGNSDADVSLLSVWCVDDGEVVSELGTDEDGFESKRAEERRRIDPGRFEGDEVGAPAKLTGKRRSAG